MIGKELFVVSCLTAGMLALCSTAYGDADEESFKLDGDAERGRVVYESNCVACHGLKGKGDGPLSAAFDPAPSQLASKERMSLQSDYYLFTIIREGGPSVGKCVEMGAWKHTLSDEQIHDLVVYIRTLSEKAGGESAEAK